MLFPHPYSRPEKSAQITQVPPAPQSKLKDPVFQSWALPAALAASIVALGTMFSSCKQIDNLQDMHDSTQHMDATTTGMAKDTSDLHTLTAGMATTTSGLSDKTDRLETLTNNVENIAGSTYEDMRQGNSLETRTNRLKRMEDSVSIDAKISEAAKFVMAMEFQLWKKSVDSPAERELLYVDAMQELFRSSKNYMTGTTDVSPASNNARMQNLYALSAALHRINPNQQAQADALGFTAVSMYDLITEALTLGFQIKSGSLAYTAVPAWVTEVLRSEDTAIYLLRVRYNFLGAMPLADISKIKAEGWFGLNAFIHEADMFLLSWTPDFSNLNQSQVAYEILKMQYASNTGRFLKTINVNPMQSNQVIKIWKHMRQDRTTQTAIDAAGERADLLSQLKGTVTDFENGN